MTNLMHYKRHFYSQKPQCIHTLLRHWLANDAERLLRVKSVCVFACVCYNPVACLCDNELRTSDNRMKRLVIDSILTTTSSTLLPVHPQPRTDVQGVIP